MKDNNLMCIKKTKEGNPKSKSVIVFVTGVAFVFFVK